MLESENTTLEIPGAGVQYEKLGSLILDNDESIHLAPTGTSNELSLTLQNSLNLVSVSEANDIKVETLMNHESADSLCLHLGEIFYKNIGGLLPLKVKSERSMDIDFMNVVRTVRMIVDDDSEIIHTLHWSNANSGATYLPFGIVDDEIGEVDSITQKSIDIGDIRHAKRKSLVLSDGVAYFITDRNIFSVSNDNLSLSFDHDHSETQHSTMISPMRSTLRSVGSY